MATVSGADWLLSLDGESDGGDEVVKGQAACARLCWAMVRPSAPAPTSHLAHNSTDLVPMDMYKLVDASVSAHDHDHVIVRKV